MKKLILAVWLVCHAGAVHAQSQDSSFPGKTWQQYTHPEDAGFSAAKLDSARAYFENSGAAGLFAVHRGRVLAAWGEINRRFICASVRKSFMSALIGIAAGQGKIDLNKTLQEMNIDDIQNLSEKEKQASVRHLLTAKSGVYHPAAYSPKNMEDNLPERGSHEPGEYWYYNNWDFNALATIFKQQVGQDAFEFFNKEIAAPLQMEEFRLADTYYRFEPEKSKHPAYLFRMSARDMARFGLLYLSNGKWRNKQIVPSNWAAESTQPVTTDTRRYANLGQYGYLWWISHDSHGGKMYFASGSGGQRIFVLPEAELVVVHVVNTYQNKNVPHERINELLEMLLAAKVAAPSATPRLAPFVQSAREHPKTVAVDQQTLKGYTGTFHHRFLGEFIVHDEGKQLTVETGVGIFNMLPIGEKQFWPQDLEVPILFKRAETEEKRRQIESILDPDRNVTQAIFYY